MLRAFFVSLALAITLLIASFGICTQAMMPEVKGMTGMSEAAPVLVHTSTMNCMSAQTDCPTGLDQHFSFLSSFLTSSIWEWMMTLLFLAVGLPLLSRLLSEMLRWLALIASIYRIRLRGLLEPYLRWFTVPTFIFAFSQGILNTKRYNA